MSPIYGYAAGAAGRLPTLEGEVVDYVRRAPAIPSARRVYGFYIQGDSMDPAHPNGELMFADPGRPARTGDYVLLRVRGGENAPLRTYVKRLVRRDARRVVVEQFNPKRTREFKAASVVVMHRILTINELFGL